MAVALVFGGVLLAAPGTGRATDEAPVIDGWAVALTAARKNSPPLPTVTFAFAGDTLVHSPLVARAWENGGRVRYDFAPMFSRIAPVVAWADLAVCHLESPVAPFGEALSTAPRYGIPGDIAVGLAAAGWDRCSTASNHSFDRGAGGIEATVTSLTSAGLGQSGMARSPLERIAPVLDVRGVRVAHLSYTWSLNGLRLPAEQPWLTNLLDPAQIVADATDARRRGAEVVIVSLHWGVEKESRPSAYQREVAEAVTASGTVDLIVGHHAHVLQPIERVNGRWVAFGLGNHVSNMTDAYGWPASSQDGAVLRVTMQRRPDGTIAVGRPEVTPTWVDRDNGWVVRPVIADLADPATPAAVRAQLSASLERTRAVVGDFIRG
jgi:poly-gamma-glutamate synthesis protein (capsule biosynthesis protein)